MTGRSGEHQEWELPHLRETHQLPGGKDFWSVKFYPWSLPGTAPIFAVVGGKHIFVCRTPTGNGSLQIIQSIVDEEHDASHYTCAWTKDPRTGTPLLCCGGATAKIKVINAINGNVQMTLSGHGGDINDLIVSPTNPNILVSASEDLTIRVWSLDPDRKARRCMAILAGDGHSDNVLTLAFHPSGNYILSGGVDHVINLWALPDLCATATRASHKPLLIHYPHFHTSEIHTDIADSLTFLSSSHCPSSDTKLILSKAIQESTIVLWTITGFNPLGPVPTQDSAPTTYDTKETTRNSFTIDGRPPYTRLLTFAYDGSDIMFMRFSLFPGYTGPRSPCIAMCNTNSKIFFWDLRRLHEAAEYLQLLSSLDTGLNLENEHEPPFHIDELKRPGDEPLKRPPFLIPARSRPRGGAHFAALNRNRLRDVSPSESTTSSSHRSSIPPNSNSASGTTGASEKPLTEAEMERTKSNWTAKYSLHCDQYMIAAHREEIVKGLSFVGRQVAWSRGGEWCVVVGSAGCVAIFERWGGKAV